MSSDVSFVTATMKSFDALNDPSETDALRSYTLFVPESEGFS